MCHGLYDCFINTHVQICDTNWHAHSFEEGYKRLDTERSTAIIIYFLYTHDLTGKGSKSFRMIWPDIGSPRTAGR